MKPWLILLLATAFAAQAHPMLQNAMWVVFAPDRVRVAVNVSVKEIAVAQQMKEAPDGSFDNEALDAAAKKHGDYVMSHLALRAQDHDLTGHVDHVTPPVLFAGAPEQTFFQYELVYPLPEGAHPQTVSFRQDMLREWPYAPGQSWDVSYVLRLKRSDQSDVSTGLLRAQATQDFPTGWSDPGAEPRAASTNHASSFAAYLQHGIMHILTGWDHLLFVTALVLATATFWEMFKVIAAFTLAHTITLAVSVLTGFRLPDMFVEPVIAGSIVFVALENIVWPQRTRGWLRLCVAFGFGLVHGLGFAGGLRDAMADLGTSAVVVALLAFSLGVEIGHQVVVLPTFGLLRLGTWKFEAPFRPAALRYGSIAISIAGCYYFVHAIRGA
jgi:hypothetical protein